MDHQKTRRLYKKINKLCEREKFEPIDAIVALSVAIVHAMWQCGFTEKDFDSTILEMKLAFKNKPN